MLKALAQLGRACSSSVPVAAQLEAPAALRDAKALSTLISLRGFSSADAPSSSGASSSSSEAAPGGSGSSASGRPSRPLQSKEWRSWIDTKLDSKLEAIEEGLAEEAPTAAAPTAAPPAARAAPRARGFELQQEIYSIIGASRTTEEGTLPEGVSNYGQLSMASDAPRFARAASNVADVSPQRLHPTRLFYPNQHYSPAELDPYKTSDVADLVQQPVAGPPLNPDEVTRLADFKNAPMLSLFLSEAGKLPVRQKTALRAKLHRHLCRQVKIARTLGILSPTARYQSPAEAAGTAGARRTRHRQ